MVNKKVPKIKMPKAYQEAFKEVAKIIKKKNAILLKNTASIFIMVFFKSEQKSLNQEKNSQFRLPVS